MTKQLRPYVGITGFTDKLQVLQALNCLSTCRFPTDHALMVGVLVSDKRMRGEPLRPEWEARYPKPDQLDTIFVDDPRAFNLIHYNSKGAALATELHLLCEAVPHLDGFQLNIAWPKPGELADFRRRHPDKAIVLQLGSRALEQVSCTDAHPIAVVTLHGRLRLYEGLVDYFLLDRSGGVGLPFDPVAALTTLAGLQDLGSSGIRPGVAGGLSAATLPTLIGPLLRSCPDISWDAEGQLLGLDGQLDLEHCCRYLGASARQLHLAAMH